jgi:cystathionine beta-lyase/cystathionine gamma-synthase
MRGDLSKTPHLRGHLVRFSVGLEALEDLKSDLAQSLDRALG